MQRNHTQKTYDSCTVYLNIFCWWTIFTVYNNGSPSKKKERLSSQSAKDLLKRHFAVWPVITHPLSVILPLWNTLANSVKQNEKKRIWKKYIKPFNKISLVVLWLKEWQCREDRNKTLRREIADYKAAVMWSLSDVWDNILSEASCVTNTIGMTL